MKKTIVSNPQRVVTEPRSQQPPLRTREGASKMEDIRKSAEALTAVRSISDKPGWF